MESVQINLSARLPEKIRRSVQGFSSHVAIEDLPCSIYQSMAVLLTAACLLLIPNNSLSISSVVVG